jgi:hypothetical protein
MSDGESNNQQNAIQEPAPKTRAAQSMALAIPTSGNGTLQARNYGEAIEVAKMFAHSGMVPKQFEGNVGAVLVAMQMGSELGLSPMSSLQSIAVINGHPTVYGDAMLALVMNHRDFLDIAETEGEGFAKCVVKRKGRSPTERIFTIDDAKKAQLWGKQGSWTQYPRRMLQLRARGFALRDAFPDALRGIISTEEARDYPTDYVDGGTPEYASPTDIPEGTHKLGPGRKDAAKESVPASEKPANIIDPKTGEVLNAKPPIEPNQRVGAEVTQAHKRQASAPTVDPKAGF